MSGEGSYVGVDRAAEGWLAVAFGPEGYEETVVTDEIGELWSRYEETADRILVDVPIGLIEEGEAERPPDRLARELLGPRSTAVFTPPVREATRKRRYPAAQRVNERKAGRGLSKQAFAISDSIAAVDELLQSVTEATSIIRESHPELCFRALAGEPLSHSKRRAGGYAERMRTLAEYERGAPEVVQAAATATDGADVVVDDVLDAVVLAYTAWPGQGTLRTLPPEPKTDAKGLPMEIVYRSETALEEEG